MTRSRPASRAARISSAAAPSTQPPDTDPAIRPSSVTSSTAPSGRGAEPNVRTTTARPTPAPSAVQPASVSSSSCMPSPPVRSAERAGPIRVVVLRLDDPRRGDVGGLEAERRRDARGMGHGAPPPAGPLAGPGQHLPEPFERGEGTRRQEVVDERERGLHARGERLVAGCRGEGVEPHEPVAVAPEASRLGGDERRVATVPAVGHDDDDAARAERPARPAVVELAERLADPGP